MRLTNGAIKLLLNRYKAVLRKCLSFNFMAKLVLAGCLGFPFLANHVQASVLTIPAQNGQGTVSGGVWEQLRITGSPGNPTVLAVTNSVYLLGKANQFLLAVDQNGNALNSTLKVESGATLNLGSGTSQPGGSLVGQIDLAGGTLQVYGDKNALVPSIYHVLGQNGATGNLTSSSNGALSLRNNAVFVTNAIGSVDSPVDKITVGKSARLQAGNGLWANNIVVDGGNIAINGGDINVQNIELANSGSMNANRGDITLGSVRSSSSPDELTWNGIQATEGNIVINDSLLISQGLTNIIAGKDVIFNHEKPAMSGAGKLYIKAGGNVHSASGKLDNIAIDALRMQIAGDVTAESVNVAQLTANSIDVVHDVAVRGDYVNFYGTKVDYGLFDLQGLNPSTVGGSIYLTEIKSKFNKLNVGENVYLHKIEGDFGELDVKGNLYYGIGTVTGDTLQAASVYLGDSRGDTSLQVANLAFNDKLRIAYESSLQVKELEAHGGTLELSGGGKATVGQGAGTAREPLGSLYLYSNSVLESESSVYTKFLRSINSTINVSRGDLSVSGNAELAGSQITSSGNMEITGPLLAYGNPSTLHARGDLMAHDEIMGRDILKLIADASITSSGNIEADTITAGENLEAKGITANRLLAANAYISGGALILTGADQSMVKEDLQVVGGTTPESAQPGFVNNLEVGGRLLVQGASLSGNLLKASEIFAGGAHRPTVLNIANPSSGLVLEVAHNARVTLGNPGGEWLSEVLSRSDNDPTALGIYKPVVVGDKGLSVSDSLASAARSTGGLYFGPGSHVVVRGSQALENEHPAGAISAETLQDAQVATGAKLTLEGVEANNIYVVLGRNIATHYESAGAWDENRVETGSHVIGIKKIVGRPGSFSTFAKPAGEVYPGLDGDLGGVIDGSQKPPAILPPPSDGEVPFPPDSVPGLTPQPPSGEPPMPPSVEPPHRPPVPEPGDQPGVTPDKPQKPAPPADMPVRPGTLPVERPVIGTDDKHFNSSYAGIRFLSRVTSVKHMDHNYGEVVKAIESVARMAVLAAVPQMTWASNASAVDNAQARASFAHNGIAQTQGAHLDGRTVALWIMPMYKSTNGFDLHANNFGYDFHGGLGGVSLGADLTWGDTLRAGLDINMGGGYAKSGGDLASTTNRMGFAGIGIYAGYLKDNLGISADIHYTSTWNDVRQDFPHTLQMNDPTGDLTAHALSAGARVGYTLPFDHWEFTPHAGARWLWLHTDPYTINSGGALIDGKAIDQTIWTFPVGVELKGMFETSGGWDIQPMLDFEVIPAAGNLEAKTAVRFTGVSQEAVTYTQTGDYMRFGGTAGLMARKGGFSLGINYNVQAGWRTSEHAIYGSLAYEF